MSYQVVIVEDDPMIGMLNRSFVERDRRFQVAGEFREGRKPPTGQTRRI